MKRLMMLLVALVALGVVPFASAQEKAGESQVTEMNFEGEVVEAQFLRPDQGVTEGLVRKKKNSLIKLRTDFVDEILKSAEDL
ncbi:MAG TPA: hypothetical protein PLZ31_09705 [Myxococcota bacterium]|nr:hypothetical protein [Myxococcota bacterium]